MREIVGGVVRYRDLVAKIKFFTWNVGESRKFVLAKISRYKVMESGLSSHRSNSCEHNTHTHTQLFSNICVVIQEGLKLSKPGGICAVNAPLQKP